MKTLKANHRCYSYCTKKNCRCIINVSHLVP